MADSKANFQNIKALALDVDGVLTDGGIFIGNQGELCKRFDVQDGLGITLALRNDLTIALISGRHSEILLRRAKELGITLVSESVMDKRVVLEQLAQENDLQLEQIAFMGDDLNDLPAMGIAGLALAPSNAAIDVKKCAHYITQAQGGHGAVREVIEVILRSRGIWDKIVADYTVSGQGDKQ
ncbi:MAG: HAD hydrolase family protein [Acidaminococcaceae bacterium]|nr:HAD hydrolase family protein [Acidaminococcaceae bacterium]